jgi:glycosyltransferase involved in cell wall biosynthesis
VPTVSVIIPSYNHEQYVEPCIQSVLDQTFQDFEIVVVDDGSRDGTVSRIRNFRDRRIRLFTLEENQGACVAANTCLDHAQGRYIAMLSSDDLFVADKLMKQVQFLDAHPSTAVVFGQARVIGEDGEAFQDTKHLYWNVFVQPNRTRHEWLNTFFFQGNCLCHPSALIRRELYEDVGRYDERMANVPDLDLWVRTCLRHDIHVMPDEVTLFRVRSGEANASGNKPETHIRAGFEVAHVLSHYLRIPSWEEFALVFPEEARQLGPKSSELVPFYVAKLALRSGHRAYQHFGIATLFQLLGDRALARRIAAEERFSARDLIALTGNCDVFRLGQHDTEVLLREREILRRKFESLNRKWLWRLVRRLFGLKGRLACLEQV